MAFNGVHPYARSLAYSYRVTPQRLRGTGGPVTMIGLPAKSGRGGPAPSGASAPVIGASTTLGGATASFGLGGNLIAGLGVAVILAAVTAYWATKDRQH